LIHIINVMNANGWQVDCFFKLNSNYFAKLRALFIQIFFQF